MGEARADRRPINTSLTHAMLEDRAVEHRTEVVVPHGLVIGRVVAVSGAQVVATLDPEAAAGRRKARVEKGHLVKLRLPATVAFGMVTGLSIPLPGAEGEVRLAELVLSGECPLQGDSVHGPFRRGLSAYPALGDEVIEAGAIGRERLYGGNGWDGITIGTLYGAGNQFVRIDANKLLGRHFAIIGSTGCGKYPAPSPPSCIDWWPSIRRRTSSSWTRTANTPRRSARLRWLLGPTPCICRIGC